MANKSDEVQVLLFLERRNTSPITKDIEGFLNKHPDEVWETLRKLEKKELIWSEESDWRFDTYWGLTQLGKYTCLFLRESGAKSLELIKDEIDLMRRTIREGKTTI